MFRAYLPHHRRYVLRRARVDRDNALDGPQEAPLARIATARDGGRLLRFALRLDAAGSGALGLLALHAEAGIQLRILPDLAGFWTAVHTSTLGFRGIRLHNAGIVS
jgi:hypothetical protein